MSNTLWLIATVIAVLGLIVFGLVLRRLYKAYRTVDGSYQPFQLRFKYAADDVPQKAQDAKFCYLFIPMLFYVGLAMAVVAHNAAQLAWMRYAMYGLTALGCLLGLVETLLLAQGRRCAAAASVCSLLKWACFAVWTVGMFAGLFMKGWAL